MEWTTVTRTTRQRRSQRVALKENVKQAKTLWTITETSFEKISAGATEKLPYSVKLGANIYFTMIL